VCSAAVVRVSVLSDEPLPNSRVRVSNALFTNVLRGTDVELRWDYKSADPLRYQWSIAKGGDPKSLPAQTNSTLVLTNVQSDATYLVDIFVGEPSSIISHRTTVKVAPDSPRNAR